MLDVQMNLKSLPISTPQSLIQKFNANSFVDIPPDVCVIPPNSFAPLVTVEYFKILRKV